MQSAMRTANYLHWKILLGRDQAAAQAYSSTQIKKLHQDEKINALMLENDLLKSSIKNQENYVWKMPYVIPARIHNILWNNNERWFISDKCPNCVAINAHGLIGRMDEALEEGTIRPITHHSTLLIARSQSSGKDYLLQGQGYSKPLLVLEADIGQNAPTVGDVLVTAGLDDLYPPNLIIGTVGLKANKYIVNTAFNRKLQTQIYLVKPHA